MSLIPIGNKVLVLMDSPETRVGGLHIPETSMKQACRGKVKAIGARVKNISRGECVLLPVHGGMSMEIDGLPHKLIDANDILLSYPDE